MRNLHIPSRSPIYSKNAMVATSHPEATMKALGNNPKRRQCC